MKGILDASIVEAVEVEDDAAALQRPDRRLAIGVDPEQRGVGDVLRVDDVRFGAPTVLEPADGLLAHEHLPRSTHLLWLERHLGKQDGPQQLGVARMEGLSNGSDCRVLALGEHLQRGRRRGRRRARWRCSPANERSTQSLDKRRILFASDTDDLKVTVARQLYCVAADRTARGGDRKGMARTEVQQIERLSGGQPVGREGGRFDRGDTGWCRRQRGGVEHHVFGMSTNLCA